MYCCDCDNKHKLCIGTNISCDYSWIVADELMLDQQQQQNKQLIPGCLLSRLWEDLYQVSGVISPGGFRDLLSADICSRTGLDRLIKTKLTQISFCHDRNWLVSVCIEHGVLQWRPSSGVTVALQMFNHALA